MKLNVNQEKCIGCGACTGLAPEVFDFNDDGLAETIIEEIPKELQESANEAKENCPVGAIEENK